MRIFPSWRLYVLSVGVLLLSAAGCSVERVHTIPFDGTDNKGAVYSVPKTYLSVSLTYEFVHDDNRKAEQQAAHLASRADAIEIATVQIPDAKSTFIIKTDKLVNQSLFISSVFFKFSNGTLESVDASSVDQTGQIIEQLGATAVNLAKAAAKSGEPVPPPTPYDQAIHAAELRIDAIYKAIAAAAAEELTPDKGSTKLANLKKELDEVSKLIKDMRANPDPPVRCDVNKYSIMLDPDSPTRQTAEYMEYMIKPPQLFAEVPEDSMDVVYVRIYDQGRRKLVHSLQEGERPKDVGGIFYRQPVALLTTLNVAPVEGAEARKVSSTMLSYAQFAPPAVAVLESKVLTGKRTTMALDMVHGGLVSYGIAQDSAAANASHALENVSADVKTIEEPATQPGQHGASQGNTPKGGQQGGKPGTGTKGGK